MAFALGRLYNEGLIRWVVIHPRAARLSMSGITAANKNPSPAEDPDSPYSDSGLQQTRSELLGGATQLVQSAKRLLRRRSLLLWGALVLATVGTLVLVDAVLRREETGLRIVFHVLLWCVAGYAAYRLMWPAWRFSPTLTDVSRWLEQSDPGWQSRLSTAMQLSNIPQEDTRFGSPQLREAALRQWQAEGRAPVWDSYLQGEKLWQALAVMGSVVMLLGIAGWLWPQESMVGVKRLAMPWAEAPWPRQDQLQFHNLPQAVALGSDLQIEIVDSKPPLPDEIDVLVREAGRDDSQATQLSAQVLGDMAVANLVSLERAIEIRAQGGDDDQMAWHRIEVVRPPSLENFRFVIQPPNYSGLDEYEIAGNRIQVLKDSQVLFTGRLSEPVSQLRLSLAEDASLSRQSAPPDWKLQLLDDRRTFFIGHAAVNATNPENMAASDGWQATGSVTWQFSMLAENDLEILLPQLWSVEVTADRAPSVVLREPTLHELTQQAELSLEGLASDDLGLVGIRLVAQLGQPADLGGNIDAEADGPPNFDPRLDQRDFEKWLWQPNREATDASPRQRMPIAEVWRPGQALALSDGQRLTIWIEAIDTLGQIGSSQKHEYTIRSPEEILKSIREQERELLNQMRDIVDAQRRNMQLATRTEELLLQSDRVDAEALSGLASVTQIQDSIRRRLSEGDKSLLGQLQSMRTLLSRNQLSDSDSARELQSLSERLDQVNSSEIAQALQEATQAQRQAQELIHSSPAELPDAFKDGLRASSALQTQALSELQSVLGDLAENEAIQQLRSELAGIYQLQSQLQTDTDRLRIEQISGMEADQLEDKSLILNADQLSLARELESLLQRIQQSAELVGLDAARAELLQATAEQLSSQQVGSAMRTSGRQLRGRRLSESIQTQESVLEELREALDKMGGDTVAGERESNTADALMEASGRLEDLAARQQLLVDEIRQQPAEASLPEWTEVQVELRRESQAVLDGLAAQASTVRDALERAIQAQQQTEAALQGSQRRPAIEQGQLAADALREASLSAAENSEQIAERSKQQQLTELLQLLERLADDQQQVVQQLMQAAEHLRSSPSQQDAARAVAQQSVTLQRKVEQGLKSLRSRFLDLSADAKSEMFHWVLEQAQQDMVRASAAAERLRIEPESIDAGQAALTKLKLVLDALEQGQDSDASGSEDADEEPTTTNQEPETGESQLVPPVASLRLVRALQQDINARTRAIHASEAPENLRRQLLTELTRQQRALGQKLEDWVSDMMQPAP
ncbi:MAG: hypothetical protein NXI32_00895 [bacterium]|nr:hypothetical protein [bacterium]